MQELYVFDIILHGRLRLEKLKEEVRTALSEASSAKERAARLEADLKKAAEELQEAPPSRSQTEGVCGMLWGWGSACFRAGFLDERRINSALASLLTEAARLRARCCSKGWSVD